MKKENAGYKDLLKKTLKEKPSKIPDTRIKSNIPGFDELINGGFVNGSLVTVTGCVGSGKTILALQSMLSRKDEAKLIVSIDESEEELKKTARSFGFKIDQSTTILHFSSALINLDEIFKSIAETALKKKVKHMLVNSVSSLGDFSDRDTKDFINALSGFLKHKGINGLFVYTVSKDYCLPGKAVPDDLLFRLSDMVICLDYTQVNNMLNRYLFLVKMRNSLVKGGVVSADITKAGLVVKQTSAEVSAGLNRKYTVNILTGQLDTNLEKILMEKIEKQNLNVDLRITEKPNQADFMDKLEAQIKSNSCKYDIFVMDLKDVKKWAKRGLLLPISSYFSWNELQPFYRTLLDECRLESELYGLPEFHSVYCMLYRKDLFKKYGLELPLDWNDLAEKTKLIMKKEKGIKHGFLFNSDDGELTMLTASLMLGSSENTEEVEKGMLDTANYGKALDFLYDCVYKYKISQKEYIIAKADEMDILQEFAKGNTVFTLVWAPGHAYFSAKIPQETIGFMPFPPFDNTKKESCLIDGSAFAIPAVTKSPTYSVEVLKDLSSDPIVREIRVSGNFATYTSREDSNKAMAEQDKRYIGGDKVMKTGSFLGNLLHNYDIMGLIVAQLQDFLHNKKNKAKVIEQLEAGIKMFKNKNFYNKAVEGAITYMERKYSQKLRLKDIADSVSLSPFFFSRIFKSKTGKNIFEYLTDIRIERAKTLLKENYKNNISQIAEKTGFSNPYHFSLVFKKHTGKTPSEYRFGT